MALKNALKNMSEEVAATTPTPGAPDEAVAISDFWDAISIEIQCVQRDHLISGARFSRFALEQEMLNKVGRSSVFFPFFPFSFFVLFRS